MRHSVGVWAWALVCVGVGVVSARDLRRDEAGVLRSILSGVDSPVLYSTSDRHPSHPWGSRSYHRIYRDSNVEGGVQNSSPPRRTHSSSNTQYLGTAPYGTHGTRISQSSDPQRTHYTHSRDNTAHRAQQRAFQDQSAQGDSRRYTTHHRTAVVDSTGQHHRDTRGHYQTPHGTSQESSSSFSPGIYSQRASRVSESHSPHHRTSQDPYSHRGHDGTSHHQGYRTHQGGSEDSPDSHRTHHRTLHYSQPQVTHHHRTLTHELLSSPHGTESRDEEGRGHIASMPQPLPNPTPTQPSGAQQHGDSFRDAGGRRDGGDSLDGSLRTHEIPGNTATHSGDTGHSGNPSGSSFYAPSSYGPGDTSDGADTRGRSWDARVRDGDTHTHSGDTLRPSGEPLRPAAPHFPAPIPHHSDPPVQHPAPHGNEESHQSEYYPGYRTTPAGHSHAPQSTHGEGHTRATSGAGHTQTSQDTRGEGHNTPEEDTDHRPDLCCGSVVPLDSGNVLSTGEFSRVAPVGSIKVVAVPEPDTDIYPPGNVKDLKVNLRGPSAMALTWTTPGDDFDNGAVSRYTIRLGPTVSDLQESQFDQAPEDTLLELPEEVLRSAHVYQEGGTRVELRLPLPPWLLQGHVYYLALRAYDEQGNQSPVSNLARLFLPRTSVGHVVVRPPYEHSPARDPTATDTREGEESRDTESLNVGSGNTEGGAARYREQQPVTPPTDEEHRPSPPEPTTAGSVSQTANEVNGSDSNTTPRPGETEEDDPRSEGEQRTRNSRRNKGRKNKKRKKNKRKGGRRGRRGGGGGGGGRRRQEEASSASDPSACGLGVQERQAAGVEVEEVSLCQARASLSLVIAYFEQNQEVAHLDYLWAAMHTLDQKLPAPWQQSSRRRPETSGGGGGGSDDSSSSSSTGGGVAVV